MFPILDPSLFYLHGLALFLSLIYYLKVPLSGASAFPPFRDSRPGLILLPSHLYPCVFSPRVLPHVSSLSDDIRLYI